MPSLPRSGDSCTVNASGTDPTPTEVNEKTPLDFNGPRGKIDRSPILPSLTLGKVTEVKVIKLAYVRPESGQRTHSLHLWP